MRTMDLHLGKPLTRGSLTLFPLWNGNALTDPGYELGPGSLTVAERSGSAVVAELVVTNTGTRPALLLEGELLEGGQQHRVAATSVVVEAGASQVVAVRCVEAGRWSGPAAHARSGNRAPVSVRSAADQSGTWQQVARLEQRHQHASATSSLLEVTRTVTDRATRLVTGVRPLPFQSGLLVGIAGQPVQLEAFDSPATLASVWDALLLAAATDAVDRPDEPTPGRRARRFLERFDDPTHARVSALQWRGRVVHQTAVNVRHELVSA